MPHEQLGLFAGEVEARAIRRLFDVDRGLNPERRDHAIQKVNDWCGVHRQLSRAASVLPPPTRFMRRSDADEPPGEGDSFGGPIM